MVVKLTRFHNVIELNMNCVLWKFIFRLIQSRKRRGLMPKFLFQLDVRIPPLPSHEVLLSRACDVIFCSVQNTRCRPLVWTVPAVEKQAQLWHADAHGARGEFSRPDILSVQSAICFLVNLRPKQNGDQIPRVVGFGTQS